ncbi:glycerol dehydrogenase [Obba rivulosa]|uniref:Glycerol dehydrogenase n=1 Tax=Obba rivulosa TaxID=1052685 RepID=A0A8E2DHQ4_9APHY|nr:glycerol dehydrogenase [Obba rivulosa]
MPNPQRVTERLFQSPSKYIQGPAALQNAPKYLSSLGRAPLLAVDNIVYDIAGKALIGVLQNSGFKVTRGAFGGEASGEEISQLTNLAREKKCDFVIGLGGGKTIDTAKAVADQLKVQVAILPTTASTDAPCSALSVIYRPSGEFERYSFYDQNPTFVLVDTGVIVKAPPRFLAAGIGDAVATNCEARLCRNSVNFGGGLPTEVSVSIAQKCEEILFKYGKQAYEANKAGAVTPAFEAVVEANTLLSGLGFESGGLAAAHAVRLSLPPATCARSPLQQVHNGFTAVSGVHHLMHGEKVAFGTIVQLVLDGEPTAEIDRYLELMLSVDLPVTFQQLGIPKVTDAELLKVAELACAPNETIWNMERIINPQIVLSALKGADAVGRAYIARTGWSKSK